MYRPPSGAEPRKTASRKDTSGPREEYFEISSRWPGLRIEDFKEAARVGRVLSQPCRRDRDVREPLVKFFSISNELG